jgi:hypothetical protein
VKQRESKAFGGKPAADERSTHVKTKALKGKALLAACLLDDDDDDFDSIPSRKSGLDNGSLPGLVNETPPGTGRASKSSTPLGSFRAEIKKRLESPSGTPNGTGRKKSKKFEVVEENAPLKTKALKGKALLAACMLDEDDGF